MNGMSCAGRAAALVLFLAATAWGAGYGASQSGNWSDPATWGDAGVPGAGDSATINNSRVVTFDAAAAGPDTSYVYIGGGGQLVLDKDATFAGGPDLAGGGTLDLNGHQATFASLMCGGWGGGWQIVNTGALVVTDTFTVKNSGGVMTTLDGDDRVGRLQLGREGAGPGLVTTTSSSNITARVYAIGGELTLGAALTVSAEVWLGGSTGKIVTKGYDILTPAEIHLGGWGSGRLEVDPGSTFTCNSLQGEGNANVVAVTQQPGDKTGLTLEAPGISLPGTDKIDLSFDATVGVMRDWAFRWKGDHATALEALQAGGHLTWTAPAAMTVGIWYDSEDGYTYVGQDGGTIQPSHPGDANRDGQVNLEDFGLLKDNFGATVGALWEQGDFNGDGTINLEDFGILKDHFGHTAGDSPISAVPEPATISLVGLAVALVRPGRKRNFQKNVVDAAGHHP